MTGAALYDARAESARADADENHRQQQREHGAKRAQHDREVAEPEDLHPERRKTGERKREAHKCKVSRDRGSGIRGPRRAFSTV